MKSPIDLNILADWMDLQGLGNGPIYDQNRLAVELKILCSVLNGQSENIYSGTRRNIRVPNRIESCSAKVRS